MARNPNPYGRYIEKRGNRFFAMMKVPKDVQPQLGRTRYIKALGTDSPAEARRRAPMLVVAWQAEIAKARKDGNDPRERDAVWFRKALSAATTPAEQREIMAAIDLEAENIASPTYTDDPSHHSAQEDHAVEMAKEFYERATGEVAGLTDNLEDWLAKWETTDKTKDMARSNVKLLAATFPTVRDVTHEGVQRWVDGLELAPATIQRTLSGVRSYWKYLQRPDVKAVPRDVRPFADLDLPRRRNGKNGKKDMRRPFDPRDVVKLRLLALHQRDQHLFDLISLAMFTGCRIEELCSLKVENVHDGYIEIEDAKTAAGIIPTVIN